MSKSCCQTFWNLLDALQRPHAIRFHYTWTSFDYQHSSCLLIILHTVNRVWYSLSRLSSFRMHNTYYVLFCKLTVCFHLLFLTYSRLFSLSKWYLHIKFVLSSCKLFYLPYIQLDWMSSVSRWKIHSKKKKRNRKGYDNSETTDGKLSARRIQIFCVYFCVILF